MPHSLDIKHLALLQQLLQKHSLSEAAGRLHCSVPALTHRLREAERRLGVALVEKSGRTLKLSSADERLALASQDILQLLTGAQIDAVRLGQGVTHCCRITCAYFNTYPWLADVLRYAAQVDSGLYIEVNPEVCLAPFAALDAGLIDLAIVPAEQPDFDYSAEHLFADELVLLLGAGHALLERRWVDAADLSEQRLLVHSSGRVKGFAEDRFFLHGRFAPAKIYPISPTEALLQLVEQGIGIAIKPSFAAAKAITDKRVFARRLTENGLPINWYAVYGRKPPVADSLRIIVDALKASRAASMTVF